MSTPANTVKDGVVYDGEGRAIGPVGSSSRQEPTGAIDPIFSQEPPPKLALPEVNDLGLDAFKRYMSPNGFDTFVTLMHYMIHQQEIFEGKSMEWGPEKTAIAVAPFVGFGNPVMWENAYRLPLKERLLSIILRWHRKGAKWQKKNPLPWLFAEHMACDFAQTEKGYSATMAIEEILQDEDFIKTWKKAR